MEYAMVVQHYYKTKRWKKQHHFQINPQVFPQTIKAKKFVNVGKDP
jgi:hypothetical protein